MSRSAGHVHNEIIENVILMTPSPDYLPMSTVASRERSRDLVGENSVFDDPRTETVAVGPSRRWIWKAVLDRAAAFVLLVPGLPLIGLLMLAIRMTSRGPSLYRQLRMGRAGRTFVMYKLRSMRMDAEANTGPVWAPNGSDSRVTPLGYWLRRLHLDELPQLFNVLKGEMSVVGPRPERPEFVAVLSERIPHYLDRLQVLPGITGLAQINLPPDSDLDSVRRKLILDQEYIATAEYFLDIKIILCTALHLFGLRGGSSAKLLGLHRNVTLTLAEKAPARMEAIIPVTPHIVTSTAGHGSSKDQRCVGASLR